MKPETPKQISKTSTMMTIIQADLEEGETAIIIPHALNIEILQHISSNYIIYTIYTLDSESFWEIDIIAAQNGKARFELLQFARCFKSLVDFRRRAQARVLIRKHFTRWRTSSVHLCAYNVASTNKYSMTLVSLFSR